MNSIHQKKKEKEKKLLLQTGCNVKSFHFFTLNNDKSFFDCTNRGCNNWFPLSHTFCMQKKEILNVDIT